MCTLNPGFETLDLVFWDTNALDAPGGALAPLGLPFLNPCCGKAPEHQHTEGVSQHPLQLHISWAVPSLRDHLQVPNVRNGGEMAVQTDTFSELIKSKIK